MKIELKNNRVVAVDGGTATGKGRLIEELAQLLRAQQEILLQRGMNLPPVANDRLKELKQQIEKFSTSMTDQQMTLRHFRAVAETTAVVNSSLDADEVLKQVMDTVIRLAGAERDANDGGHGHRAVRLEPGDRRDRATNR